LLARKGIASLDAQQKLIGIGRVSRHRRTPCAKLSWSILADETGGQEPERLLQKLVERKNNALIKTPQNRGKSYRRFYRLWKNACLPPLIVGSPQRRCNAPQTKVQEACCKSLPR
jgi:hypothetical protein